MVESDGRFIVLTLSDSQSREEKHLKPMSREEEDIAEWREGQIKGNASPTDDQSEVSSESENATDEVGKFRHEATMVHGDEGPMAVLRYVIY